MSQGDQGHQRCKVSSKIPYKRPLDHYTSLSLFQETRPITECYPRVGHTTSNEVEPKLTFRSFGCTRPKVRETRGLPGFIDGCRHGPERFHLITRFLSNQLSDCVPTPSFISENGWKRYLKVSRNPQSEIVRETTEEKDMGVEEGY